MRKAYCCFNKTKETKKIIVYEIRLSLVDVILAFYKSKTSLCAFFVVITMLKGLIQSRFFNNFLFLCLIKNNK